MCEISPLNFLNFVKCIPFMCTISPFMCAIAPLNFLNFVKCLLSGVSARPIRQTVIGLQKCLQEQLCKTFAKPRRPCR